MNLMTLSGVLRSSSLGPRAPTAAVELQLALSAHQEVTRALRWLN